MLNKFVFLVLMCISSLAFAADTYTTSVGAVFTRVQGPTGFGPSWKDPSGMIWSSQLEEGYPNEAIKPDQNNVIVDSKATEACIKVGGRLPTIQDYIRLGHYFSLNPQNHKLTGQGQTDLWAVFPDMNGQYFFWSTSADPDHLNCAFGFNSSYGYIDHYDYVNIYYTRNNPYSVRCVTN